MANIINKLIVGSVCTFLLILLDPVGFGPWIVDTFFGIAISSMFLAPLVSYITGEGRQYIPVTVLIGFVLFVVYFYCVSKMDLLSSVIFVLQWMATFTFISTLFGLMFSEYRKKLLELWNS